MFSHERRITLNNSRGAEDLQRVQNHRIVGWERLLKAIQLSSLSWAGGWTGKVVRPLPANQPVTLSVVSTKTSPLPLCPKPQLRTELESLSLLHVLGWSPAGPGLGSLRATGCWAERAQDECCRTFGLVGEADVGWFPFSSGKSL